MINKILENDYYRFLANFIAVFLVLWGVVATLGVLKRNFELQQEIDELREKNAELAKSNTELDFLVEYYKTDEFVELEARDKLGLRKPGEKVVIFPAKVPRGIIEKPEVVAEKQTEEISNFKQWLYFLFGVEPV